MTFKTSFKTALAAAILAFAPAFGFAEGCHHMGQQQAQTCVDGYAWDDATGTCVAQSTS